MNSVNWEFSNKKKNPWNQRFQNLADMSDNFRWNLIVTMTKTRKIIDCVIFFFFVKTHVTIARRLFYVQPELCKVPQCVIPVPSYFFLHSWVYFIHCNTRFGAILPLTLLRGERQLVSIFWANAMLLLVLLLSRRRRTFCDFHNKRSLPFYD